MKISTQVSWALEAGLEITYSTRAVLLLKAVLDTIHGAWTLDAKFKHQVWVKGFPKDFEIKN